MSAADGSALLKSEVTSLLTSVSRVGLDGALWWPVPPLGLLQLYLHSPEHARAVHIKAAGAYGLGMEFERDPDAARFEGLCETGSADLFEGLGIDGQTYGNDWLETVRDGRRRLLKLQRLPAVTMSRTKDGGHIQRIFDGDKERVIRFAPDEARHFRAPCPSGGWYAYPSWMGAHGMMELAAAAVSYNQAFFNNSAIPEYAIITKGFELSDTQKDATRTFFRSEYKGLSSAHRTLYLHLPEKEHEIDFKRITADTKDADFLKLLDAARDRLPIAHGVPPRMLGIVTAGQLGGGSEVTAQLDLFEKLTLQPIRSKRLAQLQPILRELGIKPQDVRFRGLDLTPPDTDQSHLADWVAAGILTAAEAREVIGEDVLLKSGEKPSRIQLLARVLSRL